MKNLNLIRDQKGQGLAEYTFILVLAVIVAVVGLTALGAVVNGLLASAAAAF